MNQASIARSIPVCLFLMLLCKVLILEKGVPSRAAPCNVMGHRHSRLLGYWQAGTTR
jgi:hypothetical protein